MNPWLRRYFSLGSVPLLLSISPSLRRYVLRRYAAAIRIDSEFSEWKKRFVFPDLDFQPENFGRKLESDLLLVKFLYACRLKSRKLLKYYQKQQRGSRVL
jgi:hypothetical protein